MNFFYKDFIKIIIINNNRHWQCINYHLRIICWSVFFFFFSCKLLLRCQCNGGILWRLEGTYSYVWKTRRNGEIRSKYETLTTSQVKYIDQYPSACLEWQEIYNLPFKVLRDIKSRESQCKILNWYLTTKSSLYKFGLITSPLSVYILCCRECAL